MAFNWNNNFQKGLNFKNTLLGVAWPFWTLIFFFSFLLGGALNIRSFSNAWRNRWSAGCAGYKSHSLVPLSFSFHLCSFYPPKINLDPKRLTYFTVESAQQDNIQSYSAWWSGFSSSAPLSITLALKWVVFFYSQPVFSWRTALKSQECSWSRGFLRRWRRSRHLSARRVRNANSRPRLAF